MEDIHILQLGRKLSNSLAAGWFPSKFLLLTDIVELNHGIEVRYSDRGSWISDDSERPLEQDHAHFVLVML